MTYSREEIRAPRLSGKSLRVFASLVEGRLGAPVIEKLIRGSGIERFRELDPGGASPLGVPFPVGHDIPLRPGEELAREALAEMTSAGQRNSASTESIGSVRHFLEAYRSARTDPVTLIEHIEHEIDALDHGENRLAYFIARDSDRVREQASASRERWGRGKPLSVLDGVPVVIKDELDVEGFPTTLGTQFRKERASCDAVVVARLRRAGAIFLGKANMHEIGINPIGINPHHGAARNPYDRARITGGSSSASAATVAAGIAPIAIGADGGGSVRIPAALCGVVGLKATFGRIPETGVPPLCWTPGHVGPFGRTVADAAAVYAIISGPDEGDTASLAQPNVHLSGVGSGNLKGVRLGISTPYFEDADQEIVAACREAVRACVESGASVIEIPPPDLNTILWAHSIIILSEMASAMLPAVRENSSRFGSDARINLAIGRHFRATDYVHALRHRHRLTRETLELMRGVDAIVTPTTACTAPAILESALPGGESNLPIVDALMRFVRLGNLIGFPAISVPAGYDSTHLPIGVHFMARPFEEHLLFRLARVVEASVSYRAPSLRASFL